MNQAVGNHAVKQFFTDLEWKLIYDLVLVSKSSNFKDDTIQKSIIEKISSLKKESFFLNENKCYDSK